MADVFTDKGALPLLAILAYECQRGCRREGAEKRDGDMATTLLPFFFSLRCDETALFHHGSLHHGMDTSSLHWAHENRVQRETSCVALSFPRNQYGESSHFFSSLHLNLLSPYLFGKVASVSLGVVFCFCQPRGSTTTKRRSPALVSCRFGIVPGGGGGTEEEDIRGW